MGFIVDVILTPIKIIPGESGDILHALKNHEESFRGFGEAYFSTVNQRAIKGWKKHKQMLLNLIVPYGAIRFVMYDDRSGSKSAGEFQEVILSRENYQRLTVPPGIWMAFQGVGPGTNMLLNIASIPHDPLEAENIPLNSERIPFDWKT